MATLRDREGVWFTYSYDGPPYVIAVYNDVTPAALNTAKAGFGSVGFWPFGMELKEAIEWWTGEGNVQVVESDRVVVDEGMLDASDRRMLDLQWCFEQFEQVVRAMDQALHRR